MASVDMSRIAGNIAALNALNSLNQINSKMALHQGRLASGKRINSAGEDPAGLTIATKLFTRSEGLKVALDNVGDAKNLLAVAESGLGRINDILVQMRNKAEQAASDTLGVSERKAVVSQLKDFAAQIDDIVAQTEWNDTKLIDGSFESTPLTFQTGADKGDTTTLSGLKNLKASGVEMDLATVASSSTVSVDTDTAYDILADGTAPTAGQTLNANLAELDSGTYTVEVTYGGTAGSASYVRLKDANGDYLSIDASGSVAGSGADPVDTRTADLDLSGSGTATIEFGNGLTVTVNKLGTASPSANGTYTATVDYTAKGDYTLDKVGGGTLDENSSAAEFADYMDQIASKLDVVNEQLTLIKEEQIAAAQINTEGSYNRIMNADMAMEQVELSKLLILQQTSVSMLAQANTAPQFLLSLFR